MELDSKIARVKELIAKREELDAELGELLGGVVRERRIPKCSICNEPGPGNDLPNKIIGGTHAARSGGLFRVQICDGGHVDPPRPDWKRTSGLCAALHALPHDARDNEAESEQGEHDPDHDLPDRGHARCRR